MRLVSGIGIIPPQGPGTGNGYAAMPGGPRGPGLGTSAAGIMMRGASGPESLSLGRYGPRCVWRFPIPDPWGGTIEMSASSGTGYLGWTDLDGSPRL
jgi:hypothetical protein